MGLILGATDGIGKCFCQYFAREGLNVILVGRRKEKLDDLAAALRAEYGISTKVVPQDLTEEGAFENLVSAVEELNIRIFNYVATYHKMGKYWEIPYEEIEKVININVNTYARLLHYFGQVFTEKSCGTIVTMSSLTTVSPSPYNAIYGAAKAFEMILIEGVAFELEKKGVEAVAVAMTPEEVVSGTMAQLGTIHSAFPGEEIQKDYYKIIGAASRDEAAKATASYYEEEYR